MQPNPNLKNPYPSMRTRGDGRQDSQRGRKARRSRPLFRWLFLSTIVVMFVVLWEELPFLKELSTPFRVQEAKPVTGLHPVVDEKQKELVELAQAIGISVLITDGFRSIEEQDAIYEQGRTTDGPIVTNARGGDSYHNYGLAVDFALITRGGEVVWDMDYDGNGNGVSDWMEVVELAKQLGFSWGGDWSSFPDYPHLQMDFGLSIRDLKRGRRPPEPEPSGSSGSAQQSS
ncbi:M15 family metallopeptidase [Paenibacillus senegalensis]|uniref:M15 family metallopeptidase n=1 Tax=Paenibacillus senegalensis TaxID=1465766 RepID=UPI000289A34E|nr:M15 family metallopeptidase [Paenibacillus senegalensis]